MKVFKNDALIALLLSLAGMLLRVPYLTLFPVAGDYLVQTIYALRIRPGQFMPLVGNDPYVGPLWSYLVALAMAVWRAPLTPYILALVLGALTVGVTYLLARGLGLGPLGAVLAGLLIAANPHHILVNSHSPGTVYLIPLFSTASLAALALAVRRGSGPWLVACGAFMALAMQTNPIPALMLPGMAIWFLSRNPRGLGLRTRWPYLAAGAFLLVYAPVIVYNVQNRLLAFQWAQTRDYLWEPSPSWRTYLPNLGRLLLQVARQVGGVLEGNESIAGLVGLPLVYAAWAAAGLAYTARRGQSLLLLAAASQIVIMPWQFSHYGLLVETRLTADLVPLILVAMAALGEAAWRCLSARTPASRWQPALLAGALVVASVLPFGSLASYYRGQFAAGEDKFSYWALFDEIDHLWKGEPILISETLVLYNPSEYYLAVRGIPYKIMTLDEMLERLSTGGEHGRVLLILDDSDLPKMKIRAKAEPVQTPAMQIVRARLKGGWYALAEASGIKPAFVYQPGMDLPAMTAARADLGPVTLIGYRLRSDKVAPGQDLQVDTYWQAVKAMPAPLTGYVHILGPDSSLVAQADQELGRNFYPTRDWQPGEIVHELHTVTLPPDTPAGTYTICVGLYEFPSLERLLVREASLSVVDGSIVLRSVKVTPPQD